VGCRASFRNLVNHQAQKKGWKEHLSACHQLLTIPEDHRIIVIP